MKPVPMTYCNPDAPLAERLEAYYEYCDRLQQANPKFMLARGVRRGWRFWMSEHPATKILIVIIILLLMPSQGFAYEWRDAQQEAALKPVVEWGKCLKNEAATHHYPVHDEQSAMYQRFYLVASTACKELFMPAFYGCMRATGSNVEACDLILHDLSANILEKSQ